MNKTQGRKDVRVKTRGEKERNEGRRCSFTRSERIFTHSQCPLLAACKVRIMSEPHVRQVGSQHFDHNKYVNEAAGCRCVCTPITEVLIVVKAIMISNLIATSDNTDTLHLFCPSSAKVITLMSCLRQVSTAQNSVT